MAKIQYPKTDAEKAKLYLHTMLETKLRVSAMNAILDSDIIPLFQHEICQLHLRHICELISIGCLAAQGDYETQRAFTEEYSPPKIFKALRGTFEQFFPQPCTITTTPMDDGRNAHHLEANQVPGAYGERDITKVWNTAGNFLHRASVKKYLSNSVDKSPPSLDAVRAHLTGIIRLLESHVIPIKGEGPRRTMIQVTLEDPEGFVNARFLRVDEESLTIGVEEFRASMAIR